jgi:uncharacterized protein (TIGR03435 family)
MKRSFTGFTIALLLAAVAHAQVAITGKWQGKTANGSQLELDLSATETALTGTLTRDGQITAIAEGKLSKTGFTFKATLNGQTAGFTGEVAGDRITIWMDQQGREKAAVLERAKNSVPVASALTGAAFAQTAAVRPEFEVATLKVNKSGDQGDFKGILPSGQISVRNVTLREMIQVAYGFRNNGYLFGAPGWIESDRFDLIAKAPAGTPEPVLFLMLQSLLEREFKLATHSEQRPMDVYVLSVGKKATKLQASAGSGKPNCRRSVTPEMEAQATCTNETMAELVKDLPLLAPAYVDKEVIDQTGLAGGFDFKLAWVGRQMIDQGGLTIFDALDMLGLKLESQKRPVKVLVIDHLDKLAEE